MEPRKLTKEDIDKVRDIEGFPIGTDEDIIALSDAPYYTACPNPFIEEFIKENGTPYDEPTDDYHREPFAADVSEGKNDAIYGAHNYHTKVPYKAIMRYLLHYTKPGDIVLDGFAGSGMTGVACQMCGSPDTETKIKIEKELSETDVSWGVRKAVLNDLSVAASFIGYGQNSKVDAQWYVTEAKKVLSECEKEYGWAYRTRHTSENNGQMVLADTKSEGVINYTVWSDVFICPTCGKELVFTEIQQSGNGLRDAFSCPHCGRKLKNQSVVVQKKLSTMSF